MPAPLPQSRVGLPQPGNISIATIAQPHLPAAEPIVGALQDIGALATKWYDQLKDARDTTNKANATTDYITKLDALETKYQNDPDYQTAPARFEAERAALEQSAIAAAGLDKPGSAVLQLTLRQQGLAAFGRVQSKSLARHVSSAVGALDDAEVQYGNLAANAKSPTERDTYTSQFNSQVDEAIKSGLIMPEAGDQYKRTFNATLQDAVVGNMIREDPKGAIGFLANPENTKTINPKRVVELRDQASAANDQLSIDQATAKAARDGAGAASAMVNKVLTPRGAEDVFQKGIIPTEGGVNQKTGAGEISSAGALGISQILPGTARDVAHELGLTNIATLSNEELQKLLLTDHVLNAKLGQQYFNDMLARYDGNIALAAAAYNAGPGRADEWAKTVKAKFGDNFSAAQLQSVIGIQETRDYVGRVYSHLGVDPGGLTLSPHGYYRAVTAVTTELQQQDAARRKLIVDMASAQRSEDPLIELLKSGAAIDQDRVRQQLTVQRQAAAEGSTEAIAYVRQLEAAIGIAPVVNKAWEVQPSALQTEINARESQVLNAPYASQGDLDALAAMKEVQRQQQDAATKDPVGYGERAHMYLPVQLDVTAAPTDPNFQSALTYRATQATAAVAVGGGTPKPFHPAEAETLKQRFGQAGLSEKLGLLAAMHANMPGPVFSAAIDQLGLAGTAAAAAQFADRGDLPRKILAGGDVLAAKGLDVQATQLRDALQQQLAGDLWPPGSSALKTITDAAAAVYVYERGGNAALWKTDDVNDLKGAIEEVTGPLTTRNGLRVAAPPQMTTATFNDTLNNLSETTLAAFGGAYDRNGQRLTAAELGQIAVLRQKQPGGSVYFVGTNRGPAADRFQPFLTADKKPLEIDMLQAAKMPPRGATPPAAAAAPPAPAPPPAPPEIIPPSSSAPPRAQSPRTTVQPPAVIGPQNPFLLPGERTPAPPVKSP